MRWYWWVIWAVILLWVIHHPVLAGHDVHGTVMRISDSVATFLDKLGQK